MDPYEPLAKEVPKIAEFYNGKSVFVTGFGGFLGKTLIEKMLWTSPDVKKIYVLLRGRGNKSGTQRLDDLLNLDCFDRIRARDGDAFKSKFVAVEGDLVLPGLGISEDMRSRLISEVNIVFHSAATVRFNEQLSIAVDINLKGTKSVLELALEIKNLIVITHISTAYCNSNRLDIKEKLYEPVADWRDVLLVREKIDELTYNILCDKYKDKMINTYVFTKNLAEHMVVSHEDRLPTVIIRPTIVTNSFVDPIPGYNENFNGPVGIIVGAGSGLHRTLLFDQEIYSDYVQCDMVNKTVLLATLLRPYQKNGFTPIYHSSTMRLKINRPGLIVKYGKKVFDAAPLKIAMWTPSLSTTKYITMFYLLLMIFQVIPSYLFDIVSTLCGGKARFVSIQRRIYLGTLSIQHFIMNQFDIDNEKSRFINKYIHPEDMKEMSNEYDENDVDYLSLWITSYKYMGKKFFNQRPEDYEPARKKQLVFKIADKVLKSVFFAYVAWYIYSNQVLQSICYNTYYFITNF